MPKAAQVLAALKRDGWSEIRRLKKGDDERTWAFHDGRDLGKVVLAKIARQYGYTIEELRKL